MIDVRGEFKNVNVLFGGCGRIHRNIVHGLFVVNIFFNKTSKFLCVYIFLPLTNTIMYFKNV